MKFLSWRETVKLNLAMFWLVFTVAFAFWWFKLSLDHVTQLGELQPEKAAHWIGQRRMIFWEGVAWLVLLALGGGALIFLAKRERQRVRSLRGFFASFSHEVKTSLASLRLQAEALKDDWQGASSPTLDRLIGDTVRLQLQLENSLFFASQDDLRLYAQTISLEKMMARLREHWPGVEFNVTRGCNLRGDERALYTVFSNLIQNSIVHGRAKRVLIEPEKALNGSVRLTFSDDGCGFQGSIEELGQLFHRPTPQSGSGLGLYIGKMLMQRMGGGLEIKRTSSGFCAEILAPGEIK